MADIEQLSVRITSDASSATSGIDALAASLSKLKSATSGGLGLSSIAKNIGSLKSSLSGISSSANGLAQLGNALKTLSGVKISASVGNQIKNIGTALSSLNVGGNASKITELVSALKPLETIGKSNLGATVSQLKRFPEVMQSINSLNMGDVKNKMQELANAMKPLADEMQKVANGFSAFPSKLQKLVATTNATSTANKGLSKSYVNLYAKFRMAYFAISRIVTAIAKVIKLSNDYIENLNLFNASMGDYAAEAQKYAETVGELMGIDPGEWMRNQGVFMTLATGFGVVSDRAYIMSKNLTQLGYDLSSFFNISIEDAMLKLQSGVAGELEPLRRIGFDLSQARLQQEAYTLGINKKVAAMTQAEKAELRYYAIMTQVTLAQGDMARTLNAPANQLRVLKAQLVQAGRAIGNIFIPALNAILPVAIAVVKVIRLIAESIASLFGFELPEVDYSSLNGMASGAEDVAGALDDAGKSAKKLQQYTMGFDELNVINQDNGSGSGGDDTGAGGGFDFELPEYDFLAGLTESNANQIFENIKGRLNEILGIVLAIGLGFAAWKIATSLYSSIEALKLLIQSPVLVSPLSIIASGIIVTVGGVITFTGLKSAIENGLDGFNFTEIIGGSLLTAGGAAVLGAQLTKWIMKAFAGSGVAKFLTTAAINLFGASGPITAGMITATGAALAAAVVGIVAGIPTFFVGIYDACKNGMDWLNAVLIPAGATAAGAGIGAIIGMIGGPIGAGVGALIGLAVGALTDLIIVIVQNWGTIAEWFNTNVIQPVANFFVGLWQGIAPGALACWNAIVEFFAPAFEWFSQLFGSIFQCISDIFYNIGVIASGCWEIIKICWEPVAEWFNKTLIEPLSKFFSDMWDGFKEGASKAWEGIKSVFSTVATFFEEIFTKAWEGIVKVFSIGGEIFVDIKDAVVVAFKFVVNGLIKGINSIIAVPFKAINGVLKWLKDIEIAGIKPFDSIKSITIPEIPLLASGGIVDNGQMFIAREAGPEMVGSIGRKTAVANNDQIVAGIASGVASANSEQNALLREQNSLLREMLERENGVYLDGKDISRSVDKHKRERGRVLVTGGAY